MENEMILENETREAKKVFSRIGLSLFIMMITVVVAQVVLGMLIELFAPSMVESSWQFGLLVIIPMYCIGFPLFLLLMKRVPNGPKGNLKKMSFSHLLKTVFICMAAVYIFNMVGAFINFLIGLIKGGGVINPIAEMVGGSSVMATIIVAVILAPIVEEVIFRGVILDKLRGYGDRTAIGVTALLFGLFHGNLSQFFYAFVLGLIFAYITIKTNTIIYSVILHMVVNAFGSIIMPPLALSDNMMLAGLAGLLLILFLVVGITLFLKNFKEIKLNPGEIEINPAIRGKVIYRNAGMILYLSVCLISFITVIIA